MALKSFIDGIGAGQGSQDNSAGSFTTGLTFAISEGVHDLSRGDFEVTSTVGRAVNVAKGEAFIENDNYVYGSFDQKFVPVASDSTVNLSIDPNSSGSTRIDLVCAKFDASVSAGSEGSNALSIVAVKGTPGAGAPSLPDNHLQLATLTLASGFGSIGSGDIADNRTQAKLKNDVYDEINLGQNKAVTGADTGGTQRNVAKVNASDNTEIVEDIITEVQSRDFANFGITIGEKETIENTNETLFYQSFGEAITNQSDNLVSYFVRFEPSFDANNKVDGLVANIYKSVGVVREELAPLELGQSVNSFDLGIQGDVVNYVYAQGQGTGQDVPVATSGNEVSQQIFGRLETVIKESSVAIQSTLESKAEELQKRQSGIRLQIGFDLTPNQNPRYGDFGLMDLVPVNISIANTFFNFKGLAQMTELQFSYDNEESKETVSPIITYYKT